MIKFTTEKQVDYILSLEGKKGGKNMETKEWLIKKREEFGLSQSQLANRIGISKFAIQNIEQGRRNGSEEVWKKIEDYFDLQKNIKEGKIKENSCCRIRINEEVTTRGMNNLFYQIEIDDEFGNRIHTIMYQRNCIANMLHETPIFEFFKRLDGQFVNRIQCEEYCSKLENVIKMLEKIAKIY